MMTSKGVCLENEQTTTLTQRQVIIGQREESTKTRQKFKKGLKQDPTEHQNRKMTKTKKKKLETFYAR